jgi:hypothetical protein
MVRTKVMERAYICGKCGADFRTLKAARKCEKLPLMKPIHEVGEQVILVRPILPWNKEFIQALKLKGGLDKERILEARIIRREVSKENSGWNIFRPNQFEDHHWHYELELTKIDGIQLPENMKGLDYYSETHPILDAKELDSKIEAHKNMNAKTK